MVALSAAAKQKTGSANLVLAGGVALNCVSNEKIRVASGFDKVWIQPAAGDAGGAIGAGLAYQSKLPSFNSRRVQTHTYLGSLYSSDAIKLELERFEIQCNEKPLSQIYSLAVTNLIEEKIIGWFHGRSEFGPRALGNRSILGRPDSVSMQKRMNLKIKFRESFRPFAPVIMEEYFDEFFEGEPDPFMIRVARVKDFKPKLSSEFDISSMLETPRSLLQATTHLDGSARVQTVSASSNPRIHGLLDRFREATGLPVLINTSFNTRGEPIVNSPRDALLAFARTEIDVLCLENFVLFREDISDKLRQEAGKVEFDAD
jgi:carbamoyltransferase